MQPPTNPMTRWGYLEILERTQEPLEWKSNLSASERNVVVPKYGAEKSICDNYRSWFAPI